MQFVVHDQVIHGTLIFDKEPILTGAEAVDSTPLFDPWQGPGEVYFKIRKNAIAPRHFLESGDQGTIAVRFVLIPVDANRTRVKIDAIYQETAHRIFHPSDGTVEKSEMKEIKDQLETSVCRAVCKGAMTLEEGRAIFLRPDWTKEYVKFFELQ